MSSDKSGISRGDSGISRGGAEPATIPSAKLRVRDRIFETACDLFYRHGIHGVGVDAIAAEAGSNKMSFYRSFASKDALVTEYLREQGCALGNAAAEISDDEDELSTLVRAYKEKVRKRLQAMAQAMGARDAATLGDALMLLLDGGYFTRLVFPLGSGPICAALPAVRALIDAHLPHAPPTRTHG
jgi:hypothetical protein